MRVVPRVVTMSEHIARAGPSTAPHQQFPAHINNNVANNHGGGPGHGHPPPNMPPLKMPVSGAGPTPCSRQKVRRGGILLNSFGGGDSDLILTFPVTPWSSR